MDNTALLWIVSLLISMISVAVFLFLSYNHRKKIDRLSQQVREYTPRLVDAFLQREAQAVRHRLRAAVAANTDPAPLEQLRVQWLEAEFTALVEGGKRHSDYAALQRATQPLVRMLTQTAAPEKWDSKKAVTSLQRAREVIATQSEAISGYRQGVAARPPVPVQFSAVLDNVDKNNSDLVDTIARLQTELAAMHGRFDNVNAELAESQEKLRRAQQPIDIHVSTSPGELDPAQQQATRELLSEIEQAYKQSVTEMNRMRTLNREQRSLILQLENELLQLRGNTEEYEASSALLEKMKLQLRDYETCTVILEMETDSLRERVETLSTSLSRDEHPPTGIANPPAAAEIKNFADKKNQSELPLTLLTDLTKLTAGEDIASRVVIYLRDLHLAATLFIKLGNDETWASSEGVVDAQHKRLLHSIAPTVDKPRVTIDENTLLLFPSLGVMLHSSNRNNANFETLCAAVEKVMIVLNHWLGLSAHEGRPKQKNTALHNRMTGVLTQHEYVTAEHERINEQLRQELNTVFAATTLTPVQRQMIGSMMEDFDAQVEIIVKAGKLIHTELKSALIDLEKADAAP
jgi:hypothetical protein